MRRMRCPSLLALLLMLSALPAAAQQPDAPFRLPTPTRWGVEVAITPHWFTPDGGRWVQTAYCSLLIPAERSHCQEVSFAGSDFRVGFLRGRARGGDWGISYVRRRFKDDSSVRQGVHCNADEIRRFLSDAGGSFSFDDECVPFAGSDLGYYYEFRDVTLTGPEFHWSFPFTTIADRVQIGMTAAGGIASFKGTATGFAVSESAGFSFGNSLSPLEPSTIPVADELFQRWQPIARADLDVAVRVAPGLKVKTSAGLDYQGTHIGSISLLYFFGDE